MSFFEINKDSVLSKKRRWSSKDDQLLCQLVSLEPDSTRPKWTNIAKEIRPRRSGKECRDRWVNHHVRKRRNPLYSSGRLMLLNTKL